MVGLEPTTRAIKYKQIFAVTIQVDREGIRDSKQGEGDYLLRA